MSAAVCFRPQLALMSMLVASLFLGTAQPVAAQDADAVGTAASPVGASPIIQEPPSAADSPAEPARKAGFFSRFFDEQDGQLDFSNFLARGGFIPIPIIITEPAVDNGFGLAAAFISVPKDRPRELTRTAVAAFKTGNGSWGIGAFRSGYAFDGRLNYKLGIGHGKITLETFPAFAPSGLQYTNHYDYGILGSALWRLGDRRFSIGPLLDFRKLRSNLDIAGVPEGFGDAFNRKLQTGALGLGFHFDSRDNPLTPTRGTNALIEGKFNRGTFGSDRDYEVYKVDLYTFDKFTPDLRFGFKYEFDAVRGDFPAYFAPSINLRGVQQVQYQGMNVVSSEVELTWQVARRWSLLAFGGYGTADAGTDRFYKDSGAIWAGGAGFRYRLARKLGFEAGVDFAYGPQGFVFYLQFGHAWSFGMD